MKRYGKGSSFSSSSSSSRSYNGNNTKKDNNKKPWKSGSQKTTVPFGVSQKRGNGELSKVGGGLEDDFSSESSNFFMKGAATGDTKKAEQRRLDMASEEEKLDQLFGYPRITDGPDRLGWLINIQPVCSSSSYLVFSGYQQQ